VAVRQEQVIAARPAIDVSAETLNRDLTLEGACVRARPDRAIIRDEWIRRVIDQPIRVTVTRVAISAGLRWNTRVIGPIFHT